jgi:hypothetical protein
MMGAAVCIPGDTGVSQSTVTPLRLRLTQLPWMGKCSYSSNCGPSRASYASNNSNNRISTHALAMVRISLIPRAYYDF